MCPQNLEEIEYAFWAAVSAEIPAGHKFNTGFSYVVKSISKSHFSRSRLKYTQSSKLAQSGTKI